jgi:hypothetical protein
MIVIIILCFLFAGLVIFFVLSPLLALNSRKRINCEKNKLKEDLEIQEATLVRDHLFQKLIFGKCSHVEIQKLSDSQALDMLVTLCRDFSEIGIDWKQKNISQPPFHDRKEEKGFVTFAFVIFLACFFSIFLFTIKIYAKENFDQLQQKNQPLKDDPPQIMIPPPFFLSDRKSFLPSVNQYVLTPLQGVLHVSYLGIFSLEKEEKNINMILPLPQNFQNLRISSKNDLILQKNPKASPRLQFPLLPAGTNQITAEFELSAYFGIAHWTSADVPFLPGVTILMMPEYQASFRNFLSVFIKNPNFWPPRFSEPLPSHFKSFMSRDLFQPQDSVIPPQAQHSFRQLVRLGTPDTLFPHFQIVGIVPSRFYIYLLSVFLTAFLFAMIFWFLSRTSK